MNIKIENYNGIEELDYELKDGKINFLFGISGAGKSSIASALVDKEIDSHVIVGRKQYVPIKFAIVAEDGKKTAKIVRQFPRVKHNHKNANLNVNKIDCERHIEITEINNNNPYLKCHSKQEQKLINNLE